MVLRNCQPRFREANRLIGKSLINFHFCIILNANIEKHFDKNTPFSTIHIMETYFFVDWAMKTANKNIWI